MLEAQDREHIFVSHKFTEELVDLGELRLNYATAGNPGLPPLLLIPGQPNSWWSYEQTMEQLGEHFHVFAVDLRGQGRSTRTPTRYTFDNMGNDLVRFIDIVIGRPTLVSGQSSGGVLAAWLSAYAKPGQVVAAMCEDAPFFSSERDPAFGHSIRQGIGALFAWWSKWLGDQWSIGDWSGMLAAAPTELPPFLLAAAASGEPAGERNEPPQNMKEYDPEWARAFWTGTVAAGCDQGRMLSSVRTPILLTHHFRGIDPDTGNLMSAMSDAQANRVGDLVALAEQPFDVIDLPEMPHVMHAADPERFVKIVRGWSDGLKGAD